MFHSVARKEAMLPGAGIAALPGPPPPPDTAPGEAPTAALEEDREAEEADLELLVNR